MFTHQHDEYVKELRKKKRQLKEHQIATAILRINQPLNANKWVHQTGFTTPSASTNAPQTPNRIKNKNKTIPHFATNDTMSPIRMALLPVVSDPSNVHNLTQAQIYSLLSGSSRDDLIRTYNEVRKLVSSNVPTVLPTVQRLRNKNSPYSSLQIRDLIIDNFQAKMNQDKPPTSSAPATSTR